jgi:Zn-finger nucleic acid-binding protein
MSAVVNSGALDVRCPNCRSGMGRLSFTAHNAASVNIDVCWPCHMIWFDGYESTSLSSDSVVDFFKRIHEAQATGGSANRNIIGLKLGCPRCSSALKHTNDLQKHGRFAYHRCVQGHGRASSFTQFLQEKNFIRSLNPVEIKSLSAKVKQIRCSSCGGPINLEKDTACSHCGSAISVLDHDAVEKALENYHAKAQRKNIDGLAQPEVADAILRPSRPRMSEPYVYEAPAKGGGGMADLVEVGIGILIASIFS